MCSSSFPPSFLDTHFTWLPKGYTNGGKSKRSFYGRSHNYLIISFLNCERFNFDASRYICGLSKKKVTKWGSELDILRFFFFVELFKNDISYSLCFWKLTPRTYRTGLDCYKNPSISHFPLKRQQQIQIIVKLWCECFWQTLLGDRIIPHYNFTNQKVLYANKISSDYSRVNCMLLATLKSESNR